MADSVEEMTDETAVAIFESLGTADSTLSQRLAAAERLIADQKVDLERLKAKLQKMMESHEHKEEELHHLKDQTRNVRTVLERMVEWGSALKEEEEALRREIADLEETKSSEDKHQS